MKTAKESLLTRLRWLAPLALMLALLAPPAGAQTQFSSYPLLSNWVQLGTNDNLLINVVDGTSATGFRTKRTTLGALLGMLGFTFAQSYTTNTVTNRYEFYTTNIYDPADLTEIFSNWLQGVTVIDEVGFYPSNLYALATACGLSNIFATNYAILGQTQIDGYEFYPSNLYSLDATISNLFRGDPDFFGDEVVSNWFGTNASFTLEDGSTFYASNIFNLDNDYVSNWFNTELIVTNSTASNYFATNVFSPAVLTSLNTNLMNWFATNTVITLGAVTNFAASNIFNLDNDYVSNWFNTQLIVTNECAAAFYGSNLFWPSYTNSHVDTVISNWFYTNATVIMGDYTNFAITNVWGGISNWIEELIATNTTASNYYETNLWYPTIVYSNYTTTNVTVINNGDMIFRGPTTITNVWILGTNGQNLWPVTNLIVYRQAGQLTNLWAGPTNVIDLKSSWYKYVTYTPCQITGITNKVRWAPDGLALHTLLTLTNASSTNIPLYVDGFKTGDGARSYTITNGTVGKVSIEYDPNGDTNIVFRLFY